MSAISERIGVSRNAVTEFRDKFCPKPIRDLLNRHDRGALEAAQLDVLSRFIDTIEKSHKMLMAADEWLTDPTDPTKYNLNPRLHDVDIVYDQNVGDDKTIRKTEKLSKLMADVEAGLGISIQRGETKIADPRKLLLEAAATMKPILEIYGKQTGQVKADPKIEVNLTASPEWLAIEARFAQLRDARPELLAELRWLASGEGPIPSAAIEVRAVGRGGA